MSLYYNVCIHMLLNIKRQERENLFDMANCGCIVIVLENCSYFCVMSLSDYNRKSHTVEE